LHLLGIHHIHLGGVKLARKHHTRIASKEDGDEETNEDTKADEPSLPIAETSEEEGPPMIAKVTSVIFDLFSYCIQFLGAFFFCGFILNILGYGYTFDLQKGLVVDKMQNIRNEVQFEREIEREERQELKGSVSTKYNIIAPPVAEIPESDVVMTIKNQ